MALPINVGELIENRVVESTRIEYKSDWDPEPIVHSITAFANDIDNSGGGYIVVGIAEQNGMPKIPISGLNKGSIDRIQKELLNKCNLIEPGIFRLSSLQHMTERTFLSSGLPVEMTGLTNARSC